MKRIGTWLRMAACILVMLGALALGAIVVWQLLSGDWKLFENQHLALVQVLAKLLLCLHGFMIGLRGAMGRASLWDAAQLLAVTLAAAPFFSNHLGLLFVLFAALFFLSRPQLWCRGAQGREHLPRQ